VRAFVYMAVRDCFEGKTVRAVAIFAETSERSEAPNRECVLDRA